MYVIQFECSKNYGRLYFLSSLASNRHRFFVHHFLCSAADVGDRDRASDGLRVKIRRAASFEDTAARHEAFYRRVRCVTDPRARRPRRPPTRRFWGAGGSQT